MKLNVCRMAMVMVLAAIGFAPQMAFAKKGQGPGPVKKGATSIPKNLAALTLTDDQKTKIRDIEEKYKDQIHTLQVQLQELQAKKMKEESEVLTPEQVAQLNQLAEATKKARMDAVAVKKKVLDGNQPVKKEGQPTVIKK